MKSNNRMMKGFLQATGYLNSHLNEGEQPLYRAHLSWIPIFTRQVPFLLVGGLAGGAVWAFLNNFLIGLAVYTIIVMVGLLSQIPVAYKAISTDILLTNQGIHSKKKLFVVDDDQFTRYAYINDAELDYTNVIQRAFDYGNVKIVTISDNNDYVFKCLAKPQQFKAAVRQAQSDFGTGSGAPFVQQAPQMQDNKKNRMKR